MAFDSRGGGWAAARHAGGDWVGRYLSLDAVEASEPEDLAPAELPLGVVDLVHVLQLLQLLVWDLLLLGAVAGRLQEF